MVTKNRLITQLSLLSILFSSEIAYAVEGKITDSSASSIQMWPLFLLLGLLVVFRKQLFAEITPESHDDHAHETPAAEKPAEVAAKPEPVATSKKQSPAPKKATPNKSTSKAVDLSDDDSQCQASTAKGTRCKRKTSLELATAKVDGTSYNLTVCKQHNNKDLKPFSDLIK